MFLTFLRKILLSDFSCPKGGFQGYSFEFVDFRIPKFITKFKFNGKFNFSPYDNRWSKTMIGYGPEKNHFVIELTYNYGVTSYDLGK